MNSACPALFLVPCPTSKTPILRDDSLEPSCGGITDIRPRAEKCDQLTYLTCSGTFAPAFYSGLHSVFGLQTANRFGWCTSTKAVTTNGGLVAAKIALWRHRRNSLSLNNLPSRTYFEFGCKKAFQRRIDANDDKQDDLLLR